MHGFKGFSKGGAVEAERFPVARSMGVFCGLAVYRSGKTDEHECPGNHRKQKCVLLFIFLHSTYTISIGVRQVRTHSRKHRFFLSGFPLQAAAVPILGRLLGSSLPIVYSGHACDEKPKIQNI